MNGNSSGCDCMLQEIRKGVYAFEKTPLETGQPVMAVHPYYPNYWTRLRLSPDYCTRFEQLVKSNDGPLVTLERPQELYSTADRYMRLGRQNGYFIMTKYETLMGAPVDPLELSWQELAEFLMEFDAEKIKMVGGQFIDGSYIAGCVGEAATRLTELGVGIEIDRVITFGQFS